VGIDFQVDRDLIFTQLGVRQDLTLDRTGKNLLVTVYDTITQKEIVSTKFTSSETLSDDYSILDGFVYKDVDNYMLPKGFLGTLVTSVIDIGVKPQKLVVAEQNVSFEQHENLIRFEKGIRYGFFHSSFPPTKLDHLEDSLNFATASIQYKYKESLSDDASNNLLEQRYQRQRLVNAINDEKISLEQQQFGGDIVLMEGVTEAYRNVPIKMKKYFRWASTNINFKYLLKTDDDCYINVTGILRKLKNLDDIQWLWWGNFRHDWPLDRYGKWREMSYSAPVYPAFACGSGNVISRDLVDWIAGNEKFLKTYQGEDVTLGIWLSGTMHRRIDDGEWLCAREWHRSSLSVPNLNEGEMEHIYGGEWTNLQMNMMLNE